MRRTFIPLLVLLGCGLGAAFGQAVIEFEALPAAQQVLLRATRAQWPALASDVKQTLIDNARHWLGQTPSEREALRRRARSWDALPAAERAQQRARFAVWRRLSAIEQTRLRQAASELTALPVERQQAARAAFAQLPDNARQAWALGPELGHELVALGPLFAYVPAADRADLLELVQAWPQATREQLARLLPRLQEAERQSLFQELLVAGPDRSAELVADRSAR
jgi:hypothetical protein